MIKKIKKLYLKVIYLIKEKRFFRSLFNYIIEKYCNFIRYVYSKRVKIAPNKIMFITQENDYCCNPKYICEELLKRNVNEIELVFSVSESNYSALPNTIRKVIYDTKEYYDELFSSKIIIINSTLFVEKKVSLKKNQVLINTWHGSLGIKKFGIDVYRGGRHWLKAAIETGKMTDYCISNSTFESDVYRKTFWPDTTILEYGHARNDIFFDSYIEKRKTIKNSIYEKYNINSDEKIILYAPTFRDDESFNYNYLPYNELLSAFTKRFGGKWRFMYRIHPKVKNKTINEDVINVSEYNDIQELLSIVDVLITDYSSCAYDFVLTKKPVFIIASDLNDYLNERGLFYPLEQTPFPIAYNNDDLITNIVEFNDTLYDDKCCRFIQDKRCIDDGFASERIVNKIISIMNKK